MQPLHAAGGHLTDAEAVRRAAAALELHLRLLPAPAADRALRDPLFRVATQTVMIQRWDELLLPTVALWPDDAELQVGLLLFYGYGLESPRASARVVPALRRALTLATTAAQRLQLQAGLARHLLAVDELEAAEAELERLEARLPVERAAAPNEAAGAETQAAVFRSMLLRARRDAPGALAVLDGADRRGLPEGVAGERLAQRLGVLVELGRPAEALARAVAERARCAAWGPAPRTTIGMAAWDCGHRTEDWAGLRLFAEAFAPVHDEAGLWLVRLAWLRGVAGDGQGAAEALERARASAAWVGLAPGGLRAGDAAALEEVRRAAQGSFARDHWLWDTSAGQAVRPW